MSNPIFFSFKRKSSSRTAGPSSIAKHVKREDNTRSKKEQRTISSFFQVTKQSKISDLDGSEGSKESILNDSKGISVREVVADKLTIRHGLGEGTLEKLKRFSAYNQNESATTGLCEKSDPKKSLECRAIETCQSPSNHSSRSKLDIFVNSKARKEPPGSPKKTINNEKATKLTAYEQQIIDLKNQNPGIVLLVETGYKYRFFGDDAKIAASELQLMLNEEQNFPSCSIPTHRLHVHIRRLVENGHKVGVVKQMETTALKASSSSKNTIFTRKLTSIYTKATLIGEDVDPSPGDVERVQEVGCIACIAEMPRRGKNSHLTDIGILVLEPATGQAIFDGFVDATSRTELEKRLEHTRPVEIVVPSNISQATERLLLSRSTRLDRLPDSWFEFSTALSLVSDFLPKDSKHGLEDLPPCVVCALAALLKHLKDFGLTKALSPNGLQPFSAKETILQMDASTVRNLELFSTGLERNKGSLCWVLDHTKTSFGSRLLRRWVSQPLRTLEPLVQRQEIVTALLQPECANLADQTKNLLAKLPDLERDLTSVLHGKCSFYGFCSLVQCLSQLQTKIKTFVLDEHYIINNDYLKTLFTDTAKLLEGVQTYEVNLDFEAAKQGMKTMLLKDWSAFPDVVEHQNTIKEINKNFNDLRPKIARTLGLMCFQYTTVSGLEYLIEVKNTQRTRVPPDWTMSSSTKHVTRWRTPSLVKLYSELCCAKEELKAACSSAWQHFLLEFSKNYHQHKEAIRNLATLDVFLSLAHVSKQEGYCRPVLQESEALIEIQKGRHPILAYLFSGAQEIVSNDTLLGSSHESCMIITGPNMGGKSSYIRQVALIVILAQIGCYVPAESAVITLVDAIFTRMGSRDELDHGRSTLLVELEEACTILRRATPRSLAILDELGRGTSSCDGAAIAVASLAHLISKVQCLTLFVTHYPVVMTLEQEFPGKARNYHLGFTLNEQKNENEEGCVPLQLITFLYRVERGGAHHSYGLNVARLADLPTQILHQAAAKAQQLENQVVISSLMCKNLQKLWKCCTNDGLRKAVKAVEEVKL